MAYTIEFSPRAARRFRALPRQIQTRLEPTIEALAVDPRPRGTEKLSACEGIFRLRVGRYRILYRVEDSDAEVRVLAVGHRREVYRRG